MNTTIVQNIYNAFRAKDISAVLQYQSSDAEWSVAGPADKIPWARVKKGPDGVADFLRILGQLLIPHVFEITDYLAQGDKVIALGHQSGVVRPTNKPYAFDFVHVWELQNRKITRFRVYYDSFYVASVLE